MEIIASTSNPKFELDPQILSRTGRDRKQSYDVVAASKKRKHSFEKYPSNKRQTTQLNSTIKTVCLQKTTPKSTITESEDGKAKFTVSTIGETKVTKPIHEKYVTPWRIGLHETKTNVETIQNQNRSLSELIAKARLKVQEKRQTDHLNADISRQRIIARLTLNKVVRTVEFEDHLKYHRELEQLGCKFIHDQVSMFNSLSRSDCFDGHSILNAQQ